MSRTSASKTHPKAATPVSIPPVIKQCIGIDVSKDTLVVCFSQMDNCQQIYCKAAKRFANRKGGWKALDSWMKMLCKAHVPVWVVMEATGVYYEGLAYYLKMQQYQISVILPNKSKSYMQSLNIKTKTDGVEARALAQMGLERKMKLWHGCSQTMLKIKRLCREREALLENHTAASNQLHAHKHEYQPDEKTLQRTNRHLNFDSH